MKWQTVDDENPRAGLDVAVRVGEDDSMVARRFPTATGYRWLYGPADGGQWEGKAPTHWAPLVDLAPIVALPQQGCPVQPVSDAIVVTRAGNGSSDWVWRVVKAGSNADVNAGAYVVIRGPAVGPVVNAAGVEYYLALAEQVIGVVTP